MNMESLPCFFLFCGLHSFEQMDSKAWTCAAILILKNVHRYTYLKGFFAHSGTIACDL